MKEIVEVSFYDCVIEFVCIIEGMEMKVKLVCGLFLYVKIFIGCIFGGSFLGNVYIKFEELVFLVV